MESNTSKVIKGVSSQTLITFFVGIIDILVFSILSRLLDKEDFGLFASVLAISVVFSSLSEAGIGAALIQKKDADDNYINTAFTLSFIFGVTFSVLLFALSSPISSLLSIDRLTFPLQVMSITILCNSINSVNNGILFKRLAFLKVGAINLSSLVFSSVISILLAYNGFGYYSIIAKAVVAALMSVSMSFILAGQHYKFLICKKEVISIANFAGWLTLGVIIRNLSHQADKLLMTSFLSIASLGVYNRPKEFITSIVTKVNSIFDTVLFPVLSDIQNDNQRIKNAFNHSLYYLNLLSFLLVLTFVCNSDLIVRIFFGEKWLSIVPLFDILSLFMLLYSDSRLCDCFFRSLALVKQQFILRIIELLITICALLISFKWGVIGVACAVLFIQFTMVSIKIYLLSYRININLFSIIRTIFISWKIGLFLVPIMTILVIALPNNILSDMFIAFFYLLVIITIFNRYPKLVGSKYSEEGFDKLKLFESKLIRKFQ